MVYFMESFSGVGGIGSDHDGVRDFGNRVRRHAHAPRMLAHGLGTRSLVDADRADAATFVAGHVGSDPANLVGHFFIPDAGRYAGGGLQFCMGSPAVCAGDDVGFHNVMDLVFRCARRWSTSNPFSLADPDQEVLRASLPFSYLANVRGSHCLRLR